MVIHMKSFVTSSNVEYLTSRYKNNLIERRVLALDQFIADPLTAVDQFLVCRY